MQMHTIDRRALESAAQTLTGGWKHHAAALLRGEDPTGGLVDRQAQIDEIRRQLRHAEANAIAARRRAK